MDKEKELSQTVRKYFSLDNPLIVNTDRTIYRNEEEIKELIEKHRAFYDEVKLNYEDCSVNSSGDVVWIVTSGIMKKVISEERACENTSKVIENIFKSDLDDKEKLFNIRRRISDTFKQNAKGEEYVWPCRFEAVLIKEEGKWVFKYAQFSLPFAYMLEGKTEAAKLL